MIEHNDRETRTMDKTPIEKLADLLERHVDRTYLAVEIVLVPEQCMTVWIGGNEYHVTIGRERSIVDLPRRFLIRAAKSTTRTPTL
jgi:hypothetical protein